MASAEGNTLFSSALKHVEHLHGIWGDHQQAAMPPIIGEKAGTWGDEAPLFGPRREGEEQLSGVQCIDWLTSKYYDSQLLILLSSSFRAYLSAAPQGLVPLMIYLYAVGQQNTVTEENNIAFH